MPLSKKISSVVMVFPLQDACHALPCYGTESESGCLRLFFSKTDTLAGKLIKIKSQCVVNNKVNSTYQQLTTSSIPTLYMVYHEAVKILLLSSLRCR